MLTSEIRADVAHNNYDIRYAAKQYDKNSRYFKITFVHHSKVIELEAGGSVVVNAKRPDGSVYSYLGSISDGAAIVSLIPWTLQVAGLLYLTISAHGPDGEILSTMTIVVDVQASDIAPDGVPVYHANTQIAAGNYYISIGGTNYQFTITSAVPANGTIWFSDDKATAYTTNASGGIVETDISVSTGTTGTKLETDTNSSLIAELYSEWQNVKGTWIAYSENSDGTDYTTTWSEGQIYLGISNAHDAPTDKTDYIWAIFNVIGKSTWIAYSENSDGTDYTTTWSEGQVYLGVASMRTEPTSKTDYIWSRFMVEGEFARINGYYGATGLGAYTAEQLIATTDVIDKTPYLFRQTAGGYDVGAAQSGNIVGGTICWNQLVDEELTPIPIVSSHVYLECLAGHDSIVSGIDGTISFLSSGNNQVHDLTMMFGTTIANHIKTIEQANEGDGVAWFRNLFSRTDYEYNTGELISVKTSAHVLTGFNAYNPATGKAKLLGGKLYQISGTYGALTYSTGETITPDSDGHFTPTADGVLTVAGGNSIDTCVHLSHSGYRDGEWEPFTQTTYSLDSDLELRGFPKLDSANRLYYDGDVYQPDGTVTRKYAYFNLGSAYWDMSSAGVFYASISTKKDTNSGSRIVSLDYSYTHGSGYSVGNGCIADSEVSAYRKYIFIKDTRYSSAAAFKAAVSGKYVLFERTPTTATADPYTDPQAGDDWGTEEFVDTRDVSVPVGHETRYAANLKDKLQRLPNIPEADGNYIAQKSGETMGFAPLGSAPELVRKVDPDGYYGDQGLGAYSAEQLISATSVNDKTPYLFRVTAGGYDTGVLQSGNIVGGTICWNQLVDADTTVLTLVNGRKYLCYIGGEDSIISGTGQEIAVSAGDQVHDLTHMFGTAVAAKMTTEIFRKYFPETDYAYNPGELISVKTSAHTLTGFNAYNPTTGTAKLIGGELYQITGTYTGLSYSTGETITPDATGHFTPTVDGILTVTGGNATDTCVHLSHSGYRDGEFEPFMQNSYPLDPDLELRGVPKLDSANRLYYDGDIYQPDGAVKRRYNRVDLGTLNWTKTSVYVYASSNPKKVDDMYEYPNMICSRYYTGTRNQAMYGSNNNIIASSFNGSGRLIMVRDSRFTNMTAAAIKADLTGVIAVFEKETSSSATADPFQSPQTGDDFGTEEFVDERTVPIPVGHDTSYQANLRDKLQRLPDIPAQDGTYLVSISGGQASFMRYSAATELPTPPTEDGTYQLKTTIVDGEVTMQWIKEV